MGAKSPLQIIRLGANMKILSLALSGLHSSDLFLEPEKKWEALQDYLWLLQESRGTRGLDT